jgi:disulfide bond formation protein DsbB
MLEGFLKGLEQPEYIHVLINPLPVYGLAMGLVGVIIGLALRSREARTGAFALILIAASSAWPVFHYGQQGYDRVKGMSDSEGEKWLDEHRQRGEQLIYVFYAVGALALVSIGAEWKRLKGALPLAITTLVLAMVALGIGGYIAYAGGHIRHKEFRFEPAPKSINATRIERGNYTG